MELRLPKAKLFAINHILTIFMHSKKIALRQLQSLIGLLNFACQVVTPGRAFCRRLIDATCSIKKPRHKIRVSQTMREDIKVWQSLLSQYNGITVMLDNLWTSNDTIELFTDSAGGRNKGFDIYFQGKWAQSYWPKHWVENWTLKDIKFLELFPVVVFIFIWGSNLRNKKVVFRVDNESVVVIFETLKLLKLFISLKAPHRA